MSRVLTCTEHDLPHDLKTQVLAILGSAWPDDRPIDEQSREPLHNPAQQPRYVLLLDDDDVVVSYLAIPSTTIEVAGETYLAMGLSAVATSPERRGQGYGQQLVAAAHELIAGSDADIGVFTCDPPLVDFYVRCGWAHMPHASVVGGSREQPFPAAELGKCTLMDFFSDRARLHQAEFEEATIFLNLEPHELW